MLTIPRRTVRLPIVCQKFEIKAGAVYSVLMKIRWFIGDSLILIRVKFYGNPTQNSMLLSYF